MRKFISLCMLLMLFVLTGCKGAKSNEKIVDNLCDRITNCKSYKSTATLENKDARKYTVEALYMKGDYYKVTYNSDMGAKQIILKNDDGVYALTPSASKQFKFESLWPNNGSHIYLPSSVISDYKNDPANAISEEDGVIVLTSVINHKIHTNYKYQKINIDKKKEVITSVTYYDEEKKVVCSVCYDSIVFDFKVDKNDFNADSVINFEIDSLGDGEVAKITGELCAAYSPQGCTLSKKNDSIFVYSGQQNYTIMVNDIDDLGYSGVSRIYDDFMVCDKGIIFNNLNSSTILYQNKEIEIIHKDLSKESIINIFNSISFV